MRIYLSRKALYFIAFLIFFMLIYNMLKIEHVSRRVVESENIPDTQKTLLKQKVVASEVVKRELANSENVKNVKNDESDLKYILQWTGGRDVPFQYMGNDRQGFIDRKCPYTNCVVTSDRRRLKDHSKYDVIAFVGQKVPHLYDLPKERSPHQKFVFATIESAHYYPVCKTQFDGYFNWTWTYRLDSEVRWGYMYIRDQYNTIVGPNKEMHWIKLEDMDPVSDELKKQLSTKYKAAAWFVSNCRSKSKRETFVETLKKELAMYKLEVDVYGRCGTLQCSRADESICDKMIKEKYYFYLAFENAFSEDYVTEKLLHAVENDAIPIVYGGANYSRFLPGGSYLDARELGAENLAKKMNELINDQDKYLEYFKWKNHYSYHRQHTSVETEPYCLFCTILNDEEMVKKTTIIKDFRKWWNPPGSC